MSQGKLKLTQYRGNLAQKSLIDVVKKGDLVEGSEYLETLLVAVPKCVLCLAPLSFQLTVRKNIKDWNDNYERLSSMVVPRSSK